MRRGLLAAARVIEIGSRMNNLIQLAKNQEFSHADSIIHVFAGGSDQHGAKLDAKSDIDVCGVYIPPVEEILGVVGEQHFVSSTSEEGDKNKPGDVDITMYSLQKWAKLACKGNPTVLGFLFTSSKVSSVWSMNIVPKRHIFLASSHAEQFMGFGRSQMQRINGERGSGKHGQRDPLIDKFGYDTKAAMHMIRMMCECQELLVDGFITYPRPEVEMLLAIRRGEWSKTRVEQEYLRLEADMEYLRQSSKLPPTVDKDAVSKVIAQAHLDHWGYF